MGASARLFVFVFCVAALQTCLLASRSDAGDTTVEGPQIQELRAKVAASQARARDLEKLLSESKGRLGESSQGGAY